MSEDYRKQVVWLVQYPAELGTPTTPDELLAAARRATGEESFAAFVDADTYDVAPEGTFLRVLRGTYGRRTWDRSRGYYVLHGMTKSERDAGRERERAIFYEATPEGIEMSAPFGDDFTHAIVATCAFALSEVFGNGMRPMAAGERHAWREVEFETRPQASH